MHYKDASAYFNLRYRTYSLRGSDGRVFASGEDVRMHDCCFAVRPSGRERSRRTGHKTVHAFVRGKAYVANLRSGPARQAPPRSQPVASHVIEALKAKGFTEVAYNPNRDEGFIETSTGRPVASAKVVYLTRRYDAERAADVPVLLAAGVTYAP